MKKAITLVLASLLCGTLFSQQWFAKDISLTAASGASIPDFKPAGTFIHETNPTGVLLYGTIGYDQGYLTPGPEPGGEGGHGKADIVLSKNDFDGNQQWTIIFGTNERDVLSNAIEDKNGDVIVSGYRLIGGVKQAFLAKIKVLNNSGSYSFNVDWAKQYGDWTPTDLLEIFNFQVSKGYVVVGSNGIDSYVIKANHNGVTNTPGYWEKTYNGIQTGQNITLYSAVQQKKASRGLIGGGNTLTLCGSYAGYGYLVSISLSNGSILNDMTYSVAGLGIRILCPTMDVYRFHEIIQMDQGDLVVLGNNSQSFGSEMMVMRVSNDLNTVKWLNKTEDPDPLEQTISFDLMETDLGISVLFTSNDQYTNLLMMELSKDGDFINIHNKTYPNVGTLKPERDYSDLIPPFMDFAVQCDINYHYTAFMNNNLTSNNSYADNIPHIKSTPIIRYCGAIESNRENFKCVDFQFNEISEIPHMVESQTNLTLTPLSGFNINEKSSEQNFGCPPSECTNSICDKIISTIYVCPEATGSDPGVFPITLTAENSDLTYWWSTGENTQSISVDSPGNYVVYIVDENNCIEAYEYQIIETPSINLQSSITGITCHDDNDGEICFTSDVNIVNATINYPISGNYYNSTVIVNSSSFCFSDLIPVATGNPGLEGGAYSITVYDQYGCSETLEVPMFNPEIIEIIPTLGSEHPGMCDGSISINVTGGVGNYFIAMNRVSAGGSWSNGSFMNPTLPLVYNGLCRYDASGNLFTYTVNVFDGNSCYESFTFVVDTFNIESEGIANFNPDKDPAKIKLTGFDSGKRMQIWPNPARSVLQLQSDELGMYQLMNTAGQVVIQGNHNSPQSEVNLEGLSPGVYIMRLGSKQEKLIITE